MSIGLENASALFQLLIDTILAPQIWEHDFFYLDDVVKIFKSLGEHCNRTNAVSKLINVAKMTMEQLKSFSFLTRMTISGS